MAMSVCLSVRSSVCLSAETRAAAGARADHTDHECLKCFLPEKNFAPVSFSCNRGLTHATKKTNTKANRPTLPAIAGAR